MYIKHLKLNNFKNLSYFEDDFTQVNCIVGNNGVGKTSILDAIHYLSFCKSFLYNMDYISIKHDQEFFSIFGTYQMDDNSEQIYSCSLKKGEKKTFKQGSNVYKKLSDHIGKLPCVIVSPQDQILITGRSEYRRRLIDKILSQIDNLYMDYIVKYNRSLEQRNKSLSYMAENHCFDKTMVDIWSDKLVEYGTMIQNKRKAFFEEFKEYFYHFYQYISPEKEKVKMEYKTYQDNLQTILENTINKDAIVGHTTEGIHKDNLSFFLNDYDVQLYGSQGQQKTFLLAIKLAQYAFLKDKKHTKPIILLDDIFDKFDFSRVEKILDLVAKDEFGQVFITDTQLDRVEKLIPQEKKDITKIIKL